MTSQDADLPCGCTQQDCNGGVIKEPSPDQIHKYACENWRSLLDGTIGFENVEVDGCYDVSDEQTDVLLTVRVPVYWVDIERNAP